MYREGSNEFSNLMKKSRRKYEAKLALKAKTQPKLFFAHVCRNRRPKKSIIDLKDNKVEIVFPPPAEADLAKNFYPTISREDNAIPIPFGLFLRSEIVV